MQCLSRNKQPRSKHQEKRSSSVTKEGVYAPKSSRSSMSKKGWDRFRSQETKETGQVNAISDPTLDPVLWGKAREDINRETDKTGTDSRFD